MTTEVHVSFWIMVFTVYMSSSEITGSYSSSIFRLLRNLHTVLHSDYIITFPPTGQECSLLSTPSPVFTVYGLLDDGHSHWYEATSHGFDYIFIIFNIELHELLVYFSVVVFFFFFF